MRTYKGRVTIHIANHFNVPFDVEVEASSHHTGAMRAVAQAMFFFRRNRNGRSRKISGFGVYLNVSELHNSKPSAKPTKTLTEGGTIT